MPAGRTPDRFTGAWDPKTSLGETAGEAFDLLVISLVGVFANKVVRTEVSGRDRATSGDRGVAALEDVLVSDDRLIGVVFASSGDKDNLETGRLG